MKIPILSIVFLLVLSGAALGEESLLITFTQSADSSIYVKEIQKLNAEVPSAASESGYWYELLADDGTILAKGTYNIEDSILYDTIVDGRLTGGHIKKQASEFSVIVPAIEKAYAIKLWKRDDLLSEIKLPDNSILEDPNSGIDTPCVTIQNNGDPSQKLDLIFVGHNYAENERQRFVNEITSTKEFLLSLNPFNIYPDRINVHYVDQSFDLGCVSGCFSTPQLICCNESRVWTAARQCPWTWGTDKIIVLTNGLPYGGSAALGANSLVASNANSMREVAAHEFGHAFGLLGDEYDYGRSGSYGFDVPNCDYSQPCNKWSNIPGTSCIPICGYTNLFRSIQEGLMSVIPHTRYGPVAESNMTWRLSRFNSSPRITSTPVTLAYSGQNYTYQVIANDTNNDPLIYSLIRKPIRMTINSSTGLITWNPVVSESRAPFVEIRVQDNRGGYATQSFMILLR